MSLRCFEIIKKTIQLGGVVDVEYVQFLSRIFKTNAASLALCAYWQTKGGCS